MATSRTSMKRERCNFSPSALSTRSHRDRHHLENRPLSGGEKADDPRCARLRGRIERFADQGHGACWLKDARVAEVVQDALLHFDGERYRLLAWVIMPNHVHAVIETLPGFPLDGVIHSWKLHRQAGQSTVRPDWSLLDGRLFRPLCSRSSGTMRYMEEKVKAGLVALDGRLLAGRERGSTRERFARQQ